VWYGGKSTLSSVLVSMLPEHDTYVEVFGGGAALLFAKQASGREVYNDLDGGLVNFFKVLRDGDIDELQRRLMLTPYSRELYRDWHLGGWQTADPLESAARWFFVARSCFSGHFNAGMSSHKINRWLSAIDRLPAFAARIRAVVIEHKDAKEIIKQYDSPATLFYFDPPYTHEQRSTPNHQYAHELTDNDHADLVQSLLKLQGMAILSGYDNPIYQPLTANGWQRRDIAQILSASKEHDQRNYRTESIWLNPAAARLQPQMRMEVTECR